MTDPLQPIGRGAPSLLRRMMSWAATALLLLIVLLCALSLPYTLGKQQVRGSVVSPSEQLVRRFDAVDMQRALLPPFWSAHQEDERRRRETGDDGGDAPRHWLGTDRLGRDLLVRCLVGGAISLGIGLSAAGLAVLIGTLYGTVAVTAGGRVDALMMRIVDVLFGLPTVLLVVLLAVAVDGAIARAGPSLDPGTRQGINC
jgi:ABC-type dipeptide/oligopeptide/nickel transport system permease subunit